MKRHGIPVLIAATIAVTGCAPNYESGKTECSAKKECPSGFSCSDNGTSGTLHCVDNKTIRPGGCPSGSTFYCSQSDTCWAKPGACSTVTLCGTAKHPGNVICALPNYHPDCNGDTCLPNSGVVADASPGSGGRDGGAGGAIGAGGVTAKGGAGGSTIPITGSGGRTGYGGTIGYGGSVGTGGIRDAGPEVPGVGGSYPSGGTVGRGGTFGTGGLYLTGGTVGRGGATGTGGIRGTGGYYGSGGSTGSSLCSGAPYTCASMPNAYDCSLAVGCVWNASTAACTGTPSACSAYASGAACYYNGCTWSGAVACTVTPVTSFCASVSSADACEICMLNSCCGPYTTCYNDSLCTGDTPNANYYAFYTCAFNCCRSPCFGS